MITVSLIEDDPEFRLRLENRLRQSPGFSCLSTYPDAEAAFKELPLLHPDVVVVDLELPGKSGIECIWQLHSLNPPPAIMVLTRFEDANRIFQSIRAGASGYLLKRAPLDQICEAIREIHAGGSPLTPHIARKVLESFRQFPKPQNGGEKLTAREEEVLQLARQGLRHKEIAAALGISNETIRTHFQNIYKKLHVRSRAAALNEFFVGLIRIPHTF